MKKIFAALILAFVLVLAGGQMSAAEAREVYVGTYDDGRAVYLLTETIQKHDAPFDCPVIAFGIFVVKNVAVPAERVIKIIAPCADCTSTFTDVKSTDG